VSDADEPTGETPAAGGDVAGECGGTDGDSGVGALVEALRVRRNAAVGFGLGTVVALVLLWGVAQGSGQYPLAYYAGLGFVLAFALGLLVTLLVTVGSAVRLARSL